MDDTIARLEGLIGCVTVVVDQLTEINHELGISPDLSVLSAKMTLAEIKKKSKILQQQGEEGGQQRH